MQMENYLLQKFHLRKLIRYNVFMSKSYKLLLVDDDKFLLEMYKKKFEKAKILLQLRERQSYTKPSVRRRGELLRAVYKQQISSGKIEL